MRIIIETKYYEKYEITEILYDDYNCTNVSYKNCDTGESTYYVYDGYLSLETIIFKLKEMLSE